jgi:acetyltransferase-like isoleucine patch superfamily enzyme
MMPSVGRLAANLLAGVGRSLWLGWGWARASLLGVRLGAGARVSPKAHIRGAHFLGAVSVASGVTIGRGSYVNSGSVDSGLIGAWCAIGYGVHIGPTEHCLTQWTTSPVLMAASGAPAESTDKPVAAPIIGHDVWIGSHVVVLRGVRIGNGSVIGAGAVVCQDIPPYSVAVGVPARVIKPRFADPGARLLAEQALALALKKHGLDVPCNPS